MVKTTGRIYKTEGIIIKRKNYGESDRILTIFTKQTGKIRVKAAGVRKITSRRSSHVELLNLSLFSLYKGRAFPVVIEALALDDFSFIKENLKKIGFAYYMCELIDRLCAENQEHRAVFSLTESFLARLAKERNEARLIHEFEIVLLKELGFYPRFSSKDFDSTSFIEQILERKLATRRIIACFI